MDLDDTNYGLFEQVNVAMSHNNDGDKCGAYIGDIITSYSGGGGSSSSYIGSLIVQQGGDKGDDEVGHTYTACDRQIFKSIKL